MIVGPGFVIGTPTKCGTHSWEALAKAVPSMDLIRPQHLMDPPDEYKQYDRYIIVRDPYERLVSMWSFICHSPNRTQWGAKETRGMSLTDWLRWFLPRQREASERTWQFRSPWVWTKTMSECADRLRVGNLFLRIEEADEDMRAMIKEYRLEVPERRQREGMYHSNRADMHRPYYRMSGSVLDMMNEAGAHDDALRFGYPVR